MYPVPDAALVASCATSRLGDKEAELLLVCSTELDWGDRTPLIRVSIHVRNRIYRLIQQISSKLSIY